MRNMNVFAAAVTAWVLTIPATVEAETFNLRVRAFCALGSNCGFATEQAFIDSVMQRIGEMNLEFKAAGVSFRPLPPIITYDSHYSGMTGGTGNSQDGTPNQDLIADLLALAEANSGDITLFLLPMLSGCWNGIPCPGSDEGFDGDDVIFCTPGAAGQTYAHEMGHFWCLRHTFTFQDPADNNPVDYDQDDDACYKVTDTPSDPGPLEGLDDFDAMNNPQANQAWCTASLSATSVDPGSPHGTMCDISCSLYNGIGYTVMAEHPMAENAMSYYNGLNCRGPFVLEGVRYEAFTNSQVGVMQLCRNEVPLRAALQDTCASRGGDADNDGWCNDEDKCPNAADTLVQHTDTDGVPDACDTCPTVYNPTQTDTDSDGFGNACDPDDDNDGCSDETDQNPTDSMPVVGKILYPNCDLASRAMRVDEGTDIDGDGLKNCKDPDDDNDGKPDASDKCVIAADEATCVAVHACPLSLIWDVCQGATCVEFLIRLLAAVNPDPTRTAILERFAFVGADLYVSPMPAMTLREAAMVLQGVFPKMQAGVDVLRIEVVERRTGRVVRSMEYRPAEMHVGDLTRGKVLRLALADARLPPTLAASAGIGVSPTASRVDGDRDRWPDVEDNCTSFSNASQADIDRDGFGDRCDPDFNNDGRIAQSEIDLVQRCIGVDLRQTFSGVEGEILNVAAHARQMSCREADLDGNHIIDGADHEIAQTFLDRSPGPSGLTAR